MERRNLSVALLSLFFVLLLTVPALAIKTARESQMVAGRSGSPLLISIKTRSFNPESKRKNWPRKLQNHGLEKTFLSPKLATTSQNTNLKR